MTILSEVSTTHVSSPEYQQPYPAPEYIDLSDGIEPGEPGYRDPDTAMLSGILMKIDRLISLTNIIHQEVSA